MTMAQRPARLVILLQELKFGGSQTQALELARGLDPERFQVELWTLMAGLDLLPRAQAWGLKVRQLGQGGYVWPVALARLARELRRRRPDILLLYTGIPNIWGRLLGRPAGVPVIVGTSRGSLEHRRQIERLLWPWADHLICNARGLAELLADRAGVDPGRLSIIPNGVDCERFAPRPPEEPPTHRVLCLGRLSREKGQATLLEAFDQVAGRHPQAELWLVGDGPLRQRLASRARQSPHASRIHLRPAGDDVAALLARAGLLALPSWHEGMPNAVLEAMASGLPVLASRLPGVEEVMEQEASGLMLPPGDVPAWAAALERLLADPDLGRAWGRRGRVLARRRLSLAAMVQAHQELFERLLAAKGA